MKKYPRYYESVLIDTVALHYSSRLKVPGGWIFTDCDYAEHVQSSVFIPDPNHEWELEPEEGRK